MGDILFFLMLLVFVIATLAVAFARRKDFLGGAPYLYNFFLLFIYCLVIFLILPLSDDLSSRIAGYGRSLFASVGELETDLNAWRVADERRTTVLAAYFFTMLWFYIATIVIAGLAIGFGKYEIKVSLDQKRDQGEPHWAWVAFSSLGVIISLWLILPDFLSSPMEPLGSYCSRGCKRLNLGVFPYFGRFIFLIFGWNLFLYIFLVPLTWKITKRRLGYGD